MKLAQDAREGQQQAIETQIREREQDAHRAEREIPRLEDAPRQATARVREIDAQRAGPFGGAAMEANLRETVERGVTISRQIASLRSAAEQARQEAARLRAAMP